MRGLGGNGASVGRRGDGGRGGELFDYFFVDGYHTTEHALADLRNACAGSKVGGIVALDDCTQIDVAVAWRRGIRGFAGRTFVGGRASESGREGLRGFSFRELEAPAHHRPSVPGPRWATPRPRSGQG